MIFNNPLDICKKIDEFCIKDINIIFLLGNIADGKTTLVKEYVKFKNLPFYVTSPTYNLMHQYGEIFHYDCYNKSLSYLLDLGILDLLYSKGMHFVEWGDSTLFSMIDPTFASLFCIRINRVGESRYYELGEKYIGYSFSGEFK